MVDAGGRRHDALHRRSSRCLRADDELRSAADHIAGLPSRSRFRNDSLRRSCRRVRLCRRDGAGSDRGIRRPVADDGGEGDTDRWGSLQRSLVRLMEIPNY